jgi:hypothetical protein
MARQNDLPGFLFDLATPTPRNERRQFLDAKRCPKPDRRSVSGPLCHHYAHGSELRLTLVNARPSDYELLFDCR